MNAVQGPIGPSTSGQRSLDDEALRDGEITGNHRHGVLSFRQNPLIQSAHQLPGHGLAFFTVKHPAIKILQLQDHVTDPSVVVDQDVHEGRRTIGLNEYSRLVLATGHGREGHRAGEKNHGRQGKGPHHGCTKVDCITLGSKSPEDFYWTPKDRSVHQGRSEPASTKVVDVPVLNA